MKLKSGGDIYNPTRKAAALGVEGGEGGEPENKQRIKRPKNKTQQSLRNDSRRRRRHPARNVAAESSYHPMLRKPATTIPKQHRLATCFFAPGRAGDLQSATMFPGILEFHWTFKGTAIVQAAPILAKGSLQQSPIISF